MRWYELKSLKMIKMIFIISVILCSVLLHLSVRAASIEIGNYVKMGQYNGIDILWRVVDIDDNGPLLITDSVLPGAKEYDAPGTGGSHDRNNVSPSTGKDGLLETRIVKGSDYWSDSNIRDWLNSDASAVTFTCGNAPSYVSEKGFLNGFYSR